MKRGPLDELINEHLISKKAKTQNDALFIAAKEGNTAEVIALLKQGADINFISHDDDGKERSILMIACKKGHSETVEALLAHDITIINNQNDEKDTALTVAAMKGRTQIVKFLLEQGANVKQKDKMDWTPLMLACQGGHTETAAVLLAHDEELLNVVDQDNDSALTIASYNGCLQTVKLLLQHGANAKQKDNTGCTSLMFACQNGHTETAAVLLAYVPNLINEVNQSNNSALTIASNTGQTQTVKFLLEKGANAKQKDDQGWTSLMYASQHGYVEIAAVLLAHDPSIINEVNLQNDSALTIASKNAQPAMVKFLLAKGANAKQKDNSGTTALMFASKRDDVETTAILLAYEPSLINEVNQNNDSALTFASHQGWLQMVKFLLKNDANIHQADNFGQTSIMDASKKGFKEIVKVLVEYDPSIIKKANNLGKTALMLASANGHAAIVDILLSYGLKDKRELDKALNLARNSKHEKVVVLINEALLLYTFIEDDIIEVYKLKLSFDKQCQLTEEGLVVAKEALFKHLYLSINPLKDCYSNVRQKRVLANKLVDECLLNKNRPLKPTSFDGFLMQNHKPFLLGMIAAKFTDCVPMEVINKILKDLTKDPRASAVAYTVGFNLAKQRQKSETKKTHWLQKAVEYSGLKKITKAFGA